MPARIVGAGDAVAGALGADVEIDPPHRDAADEGGQEREQGRQAPAQPGEGGAGDQDRLAQGDDHEQAAALGHVAALDVPIGGGRAAEAGRPEALRRAQIFDAQGDQPAGQAELVMGQAAGQPEQARQAEPQRDPDEVAVVGGAVRTQGPEHEQAAPDLHRDIGEREGQAALVERARDRAGQDQAGQHQAEQHEPDRDALGIDPVGDPAGVDPDPPDRRQQQQGLDQARQAEMGEQSVGQLGDREYEHQVEEQLDEGDPAVLALDPTSQQIGLGREPHAKPPSRSRCQRMTMGRPWLAADPLALHAFDRFGKAAAA